VLSAIKGISVKKIFILTALSAQINYGMDKPHNLFSSNDTKDIKNSIGKNNTELGNSVLSKYIERIEKFLIKNDPDGLKKCLKKDIVKRYIAFDQNILVKALYQTNNPLMIKDLIEHGANIKYEYNNETIFHLIAGNIHFHNKELLLALTSQLVALHNSPHHDYEPYKYLSKETVVGSKTAFTIARNEQKSFLRNHNMPMFYLDDQIEKFLNSKGAEGKEHKKDLEYIVEAYNGLRSEKKFGPNPAFIIHNTREDRAIQLINPLLWSLNRWREKFLKQIAEYRKKQLELHQN
jgi:hypothetical protein